MPLTKQEIQEAFHKGDVEKLCNKQNRLKLRRWFTYDEIQLFYNIQKLNDNRINFSLIRNKLFNCNNANYAYQISKIVYDFKFTYENFIIKIDTNEIYIKICEFDLLLEISNWIKINVINPFMKHYKNTNTNVKIWHEMKKNCHVITWETSSEEFKRKKMLCQNCRRTY